MSHECKICGDKIIFDIDYYTHCHTLHKMKHHSCWSDKINAEAKKDFDNS